MADLSGQTIASSYEQLLSLPDGGGNANTLVAVTDGDGGTTFGIKLATNKVEIIPGSNDTNAFEVSQADGTAVLTVDSTNAQVGIGISSSLASGAKLHVKGNDGANYIHIESANDDNYLTLGTFENDQVVIAYGDTDTGGSSALNFYKTTSAPFGGTSLVMSLDSSGSMGVGVASASSYHSDFNNLVVYENGNAGISIIGSTSGESSLGFGDGTGADTYRGAVAYVHTSGSNQDKMFFKTSSLNRMVIDSSGSVGIGNTSPDAKFHVSGQSKFQTDSEPVIIIAGTESATDHTNENSALCIDFRNLSTTNGVASGIVGLDKDGLELTKVLLVTDNHDGNDGSIRFHTSTDSSSNHLLERMHIAHDGKVGIGTSSVSASCDMELRDSDGFTFRLSKNITDANSGDNFGSIQFSNNNDATGAVIQGKAAGNWSTNNYPTDIIFYTAETSDVFERMRIKNDGDIFIAGDDKKIIFNTSGASGHPALSMDSSVNFKFLNSSGAESVRIANNGTLSTVNSFGVGVTDPDSYIEIKSDGLNSQGFFRIRNSNDAQMVEIANDSSGVPFINIGNAAGSTKITLKETGSSIVYAGSATALQIDTSANGARTVDLVHSDGAVDNQDEILRCRFSGTGSPAGGRFIAFEDSQARMGMIEAANGDDVAYTVGTSDINTKKNIENWDENVLEHFKTLKPKRFHYKRQEDSKEKKKGYIAQDLKDAFPEAYPLSSYKEEDGDKQYYGFNPSGMVVYLMKAVQELSQKVEELENKLGD